MTPTHIMLIAGQDSRLPCQIWEIGSLCCLRLWDDISCLLTGSDYTTAIILFPPSVLLIHSIVVNSKGSDENSSAYLVADWAIVYTAREALMCPFWAATECITRNIQPMALTSSGMDTSKLGLFAQQSTIGPQCCIQQVNLRLRVN